MVKVLYEVVVEHDDAGFVEVVAVGEVYGVGHGQYLVAVGA